MEYLAGVRAVLPYRLVYSACVAVGATVKLDLVWNFADVMNALMAIPNIIVVLLLSGLIARETKHYVWDKNLDETDDTPIPVLESK